MTTITLHQQTTATPEQFVAALTDFGPGRKQLFPNSSDDSLQVHHLHLRRTTVMKDRGQQGQGVWQACPAN